MFATEQRDFANDVLVYVAKAAGGLVILLGGIVLMGWFIESAPLVQLRPQLVPMQFNTALGFVFCGAGLLFLIYGRRQLAMSCGVFSLALGLLTVLEYLYGLDFGIDQFFLEPFTAVKTTYPGRMAQATALAFILSGLGLVIASLKLPLKWRAMACGLLGTIIAAIGVGTLFGYLLGRNTPFDWSHLTYMAVHTALGFFLLGMGMLAFCLRAASMKRRLPNWISAVVSIGLAALAISLWQLLLTYEQMQIRQITANQAINLGAEVQRTINQQVLAMERMARRWEDQGGTPAALWKLDAERYLQHQPSLQAVAWVDPSMHLRWIEPLLGNERAKDLYLGFESRRKQALETARLKRVTTSTRNIELVQGGKAILVYAPLYIDDRFDGYIGGVFRIHTLFKSLVTSQANKGYGLVLYEDDEEIYRHVEPGAVYEPSTSQEQKIGVLNLNWRLSLQPSKALLTELKSPLPLIALMVGLLLALLMALAVHFAQTARRRADSLLTLNQQLADENEERRRIEQSLEESGLWMQGIFNALEEGVMVVDPERMVTNINPACQAILGYSSEKIAGQSTEMLHVDHEHYVEFGERIRAAFEQGETAHFEFETKRKNGEIFPSEHTVSLLKSDSGETLGIVSVLRDITERKQAEAELQRHREHLEELVEDRTSELEDANIKLLEEIAEHKRTEAALFEHEQYLQSMFDNMQEGVITTDEDLKIETANPAALAMLGYDLKQLVGQNANIFMPAPDRAPHAQQVKRYLRQDSNQQTRSALRTGPREVTAVRADGTELEMSIALGEMSLAGQRRFIALIKDVTERNKSEEALKQSEEQFRQTVELSPIPTVITDQEGNVEHFNRKFVELFGWTTDDVRTPEEWWKAAYPDEVYRNKVQSAWQEAVESRNEENTEIEPQQWTLTCKNGEKREVEYRMARIAANRSVITMDDITERKLAQQALEHSQIQLRQLANHLQTIREEERTRIARDVHDEIGQVLTALNMDVHWLYERISDKENDTQSKVLSMTSLIATAIASVQRITSELRPAMLDELGLASAIQWSVEEFQERTGIKCKVSVSVEDMQLDPGRATAVFRILQEALTNVIRHSEASEVELDIHRGDGHLEMRIKDNGQGISPSAASADNAFGLLGMKERALSFGGRVEIEGRSGEGTTVFLHLPLSNQSKGA